MFKRYTPWLLWGFVLWGATQIHHLPWSESHSVCGVWGCGPPLPALISFHAIWLVVLAPLGYFSYQVLSPKQLRQFGIVFMSGGTLGVLGLGAYQFFTWLPSVSEFAKPYFLNRWAFVVITLTDVPVLELTLLGAICYVLGFKSKEATLEEPLADAEIRLVTDAASASDDSRQGATLGKTSSPQST